MSENFSIHRTSDLRVKIVLHHVQERLPVKYVLRVREGLVMTTF